MRGNSHPLRIKYNVQLPSPLKPLVNLWGRRKTYLSLSLSYRVGRSRENNLRKYSITSIQDNPSIYLRSHKILHVIKYPHSFYISKRYVYCRPHKMHLNPFNISVTFSLLQSKLPIRKKERHPTTLCNVITLFQNISTYIQGWFHFNMYSLKIWVTRLA
jgi:hypothetical protein